MKKRQRFSPPAVGASALLVSFAIVVLCVFALLCVSSVQAEARLAETAMANTAAYYEADLQAEEIFARLRGGALPPQVTQEENRYHYTVPVTGTQRLEVTLSREGAEWTVLRWQAVALEPAPAEETLHLWNGNLP